ncbi:hypothetical protein [Streptomyces sp. NPDC020597]|uniref:hypothetical protein n=1 Tax=unclassified Streptomyces TaxID=2593676 RepID=UPI003788C1E4
MTTAVPTGPAWVHPGLLRADCLSAGGGPRDSKWLRPGVHLRVFPSPQIGFPLCPFTVWVAGDAVPGPGSDGTDIRFDAVDPLWSRYVGAWSDGRALSVLDAAGRTTGRCSGPGAFVARVPLAGVRCEGGGRVWPAVYRSGLSRRGRSGVVLPDWLPRAAELDVDTASALDAIGSQVPRGAWWCGADSRFPSADLGYRLSGVPDAPLPYDDMQPADAAGRATAQAIGLQEPVADAWSRPPAAPAPATAQLTRSLPATVAGGQDASASVDMSVALWAASVDPAAARWWGFGTTLPVSPQTGGADGWPCYAVAALFALPAPASGPQAQWVRLAEAAQADPLAGPFTDALLAVHGGQGLPDLVGELEAAGHTVVCLWTLAVEAPPPDVPDAPSATARRDATRWNPDGTWTAALALHGTAGGPLAVLRSPDTPLNEYVLPGEPWRQPLVAPAARDTPSAAAFTDYRCPPGAARWRVATADMWGQWSDFAPVDGIDPPDLPAVPQPTATLALLPADPAPGGDGPYSPGAVSLRVSLPQPVQAAPPVTTVRATLDNAAGPVLLAQDPEGMWTGTACVRATTPGESVTVRCEVEVRDAAGRQAGTSASLAVLDPRPRTARSAAPVLLFTGQRAPDGYAELDVTAALPAGLAATAGWHLYIADEQLLDPQLAPDDPRWKRAGSLRARVGQARDRSGMARLTDASIEPGPGTRRVRCRLPGRLEQVQVCQLVPVTDGGQEAPATDCGCFTVAVPLSDTPPAPSLAAAEADPDGRTVRLTLSVRFPGTRPPGDPPPGPVLRRGTKRTSLPARVRRSATGTAPETWPVVGQVELVPADEHDREAGWQWTASYEDVLPVDTPAWTPLSYVCEAAWPDEPAWDPEAVPAAGEIRPTWPQPAAQPGLWSAPSQIVTLVRPRPRPAIRPAYTDHGDGHASISVTVPVAHPRAAPWSLTAAAAASTPPASAHTTGPGPELVLGHLDAAIPPAHWLVAVTTPDGTLLPLARADATTPAGAGHRPRAVSAASPHTHTHPPDTRANT